MSTTATVRNGIDVDRLLETIHAIETDPVQGSFTFSATSTWSEGTHNYAVGYVANAAAQGIEIASLEVQVEGDLDVGNFLGLAGPRPGFTAIRAHARVSSPNATKDQLTALCQYVQDSSPVRDCLANPVPVKTTLDVT